MSFSPCAPSRRPSGTRRSGPGAWSVGSRRGSVRAPQPRRRSARPVAGGTDALDKIDTALHFDVARRLLDRGSPPNDVIYSARWRNVRHTPGRVAALINEASERAGSRLRDHVTIDMSSDRNYRARGRHFRCRTMIDASRPVDDQFPATP